MSELLKRLFGREGKERFERIIDRLIRLNVLILIIASAYVALTDVTLSVRNSGAFIMPLMSLAALASLRENPDEAYRTSMAIVIFFGLRELFLLIYYPRPF